MEKSVPRLKYARQSLYANNYLDVLLILIERNLKVRYRGSTLGIYWSLINPLIMTGVYSALFGAAFAEYYNDSILNYSLAAFTGMVVINFFSASTSQALSSIVMSGDWLNKMSLPVSAFPISMVGANLYQLCAGALPILALATLIISGSFLNIVALALPLMGLVMVSTGVGLMTAAMNVFYRDIPYLYELATFGLWISSPIFYPVEIVPEKVRAFLVFHPVLPIIQSVRQIVLSGAIPDVLLMIPIVFSSLVFLGLGWLIFLRLKPQFMDLL